MTPILFYCTTHKIKDSKNTAFELKTSSGCYKCKSDKMSLSGKGNPKINGRMKDLEFKRRVFERFKDNIKVLTSYITSEDTVKLKCMICLFSWETKPFNVLASRVGCPKCGRKQANKKTTKTPEKYDQQIKKKTKGVIVRIDDYINDHSKIKHKCLKCTYVFYKQPNWVLYYGREGCTKCLGSNDFSQIGIQWLSEVEIKYKFKNLKHALNSGEERININGKTIEVDGYDSKSKTVFEFLGDVWHGNPDVYASTLCVHPYDREVTAGELFASTIRRLHLLAANGYNVLYVWETCYNNCKLISGYMIGNNKGNLI